jgi:hypothetical protein
MKKYLFLPLIILFFIVMSFTISTLTVTNTKHTIDLILHTILPSLLPFILLTLLFIEFGGVEILAFFFQFITLPLLNLSGEGFCAYLSALIGGSPLGAVVTSKLIDEQTISLKEGQKIFNIAAYASPGFIFVTLLGISKNKNNTIALIVAYYLSSVLILMISNLFYKSKLKIMSLDTLKQKLRTKYKNLNLAKIIKNTIKTSANSLLIISGTMVLFNLPFSILSLFLNEKLSLMVSGFFEFSRSSLLLISLFEDKIAYFVIGAILSSGGLSMFIQNVGVSSSKLKIPSYLYTRVAHILLCTCFLWLFFSF